jgi:toxin ParE1/3/4
LTETAEADLAEIWAYVALDASETTATRLIEKLKNSFEPLRHFPASGAARDPLAPGLRAIFAGGYGVYYLHNEQELVIVRVLHGARDAAAFAEHGGFRGL